MASGDDPTADYMNVMGFQGLTNPNPYLEFTGQIPMAGYMGAPTNAAGAPIQSYLDAQAQHNAWQPPASTPSSTPGTTLNNTQQWWNNLSQPSLMNPSGNAALGMANWGAFMGPQAAIDQASPGFLQPGMQGYQGGATGAAAPGAGAAAPQNPVDMRQAYLTALSNPGKVATPGAQILPGTSMTGPVGSSQPSVLQAFLAAHPQGGSAPGAGPGGFSNAGFFNTLKQLQAGGQT
jgi:hypothetical protein